MTEADLRQCWRMWPRWEQAGKLWSPIPTRHGFDFKNRNTVVKAYSELKSDAWIESRQGVGYVVAAASSEKAPEEESSEVQSGRVNWVSEVADKYLDMEKTF